MRVEFDGELFVGKPGEESWIKADIKPNPAVEGARNTGWNNGFLALAEPIIKALQNGETSVENAATFEDGYRNQVVLDAARESSEKGCAVKLDFQSDRFGE